MILGHLSFRSSEEHSGMLHRIAGISSCGHDSFRKVTMEGFEGGYFLCSGLPYCHNDFLYKDDSKGIMVLLSGSIYNREELLRKLEIISPVSDPELVSKMFLKGGPGFVEELNGDFAIFIYQPKTRQSYLFRDHIGIRPLAFASDGNSIFFSSDILGLSRVISRGEPIDPEYLLANFKFIDLHKGPFQGVTKLPPGHYLSFSPSETNIVSYWEPGKIKVNRKLDKDNLQADIRSIISDAVKIRCDSRFRAGAHVTGGLDSGIVSMLALKEYGNQDGFYGFSWSPENYLPENIKYDEREIINESYRSTDLNVVYASIDRDEFPGYVNNYYYNQGYFSEDKASDTAVLTGTNLIFAGWGGDEFVSTADRGIDIDLLFRFRLRAFFRRNSVTRPRRFIKSLLFYVFFPIAGILDRDTARSFRDEAKYLKRSFKRSNATSIKTFYFHSSRKQMHLRLLKHYHLQQRCESWYLNGYRKGLEYRYPLLDKRIVEYIIALPSELLCMSNSFRPLLREAFSNILPGKILSQLDKTDPVYWRHIHSLIEESAVMYMDELQEWESNQDLSFVDFRLLRTDIGKYRQKTGIAISNSLSRSLVYLKALHEFTRNYRTVAEPQ